MSQKKLYILSGLGADKRVFQKIDFSNYDTKFIDWIEPKSNEKIEDYASRISKHIDTGNPILIGLSFGGIIATEVAKHVKCEKLILIASAKTKFEIPSIYRIIGKLNLDKLVPSQLLTKPNFILDWIFGVKNKTDKILLAKIIQDTDPIFLKWAIRKILTWKNIEVGQNSVHIHGTNDRILPYKNITNPIKVNKGGHFMTIDKSEEITKLLQIEIEK